MGLGIGKMGLRPSDFWAMSLLEWICAAEGFAEFHGNETKDLPTLDEIAEAIREDEARNGNSG
jgi:hypothetical protein